MRADESGLRSMKRPNRFQNPCARERAFAFNLSHTVRVMSEPRGVPLTDGGCHPERIPAGPGCIAAGGPLARAVTDPVA